MEEVTITELQRKLKTNFYYTKQLLKYLPYRKVPNGGKKPLTLVKIDNWDEVKELLQDIKKGCILPNGLSIREDAVWLMEYNK